MLAMAGCQGSAIVLQLAIVSVTVASSCHFTQGQQQAH
jgi:hypothetical protein